MTKKIADDLVKVVFDDKKGKGNLINAHPFVFPPIEIDIYFGYDGTTTYSYSSDSFWLRCKIDESVEDVYDDCIEFYNEDKKLIELNLGEGYVFGAYDDRRVDYDDCCYHERNIKHIKKIIKANNLCLRLKSETRKDKDILIEHKDLIIFQDTLQTFLDFISNEKAQIRFISAHDASYKRIIPATKAEADKTKEEMMEDDETETTLEEKKAHSQTKAQKQIYIIWTIVLLMSIALLIVGIVFASGKLFWYGLVALVVSIAVLAFSH